MPADASQERADACARAPAQAQLLAFRTQFIVAGPGLVPWNYDAQFVAGMSDYLGADSGVGNLTVRNWAPVNLANFPVRCCRRASAAVRPAGGELADLATSELPKEACAPLAAIAAPCRSPWEARIG
jgi:hypothetical protein